MLHIAEFTIDSVQGMKLVVRTAFDDFALVHHEDEIGVEIKENNRILIETLASFGVTASIKGVDRGPRITRYEVVPAKGVKVNQITNLFDDSLHPDLQTQ